jgi:Icc-related predicted phosphoesterase
VKILCVSDTVMPQMESAVNLRRHYGDVELIVSCGDMPSVYLEFITSILNVPLFYIRGNHDEGYKDHPPGGENLHARFIEYNGLTFYGLEGSIRYNNSPIQYTEGDMSRMVLGALPRLGLRRQRFGYAVDFFVTHSPPRGIHDAEDMPHRGFQAFHKFLDWYRPRYMLHGHVHTYDRRTVTRTEYLDTCIINVNPVTVLEVEPVSSDVSE